jgi:hypothetical protein
MTPALVRGVAPREEADARRTVAQRATKRGTQPPDRGDVERVLARLPADPIRAKQPTHYWYVLPKFPAAAPLSRPENALESLLWLVFNQSERAT